MIPAHDLTIGNWVYDGERTQFPMFIRGIGEDYVYLDFEGNEGDLWESTSDELQGIPLTGDLLQKMGFEKKNYCCWLSQSYKSGVKVEVIVYIFSNAELDIRLRRETPHFMDQCYCNTIHYLHEFQNLYRTITKQQLIVNLQ